MSEPKEKPAGWKVPWEPYSKSTLRWIRRILEADPEIKVLFDDAIRSIMDEHKCSQLEAYPEAARRTKVFNSKSKGAVRTLGSKSRKTEDFEAAFNSLPNTANPRVEWDWIASHPVIMRQERKAAMPPKRSGPGRPSTKPVVTLIRLSARDILHAANGPAPSKRAVTQLQNLCNKPQDFFKQVAMAHKKQQEEGADEKAEAKDPGIEEVRRLLLEFTGEFMGV